MANLYSDDDGQEIKKNLHRFAKAALLCLFQFSATLVSGAAFSVATQTR